jgi:hypothetical protein
MFVDEERLWDGSEPRRIIWINQGWKRYTKSIVVSLRRRNSLGIKRQADDGEVIATELPKSLLPPGQVVAAESPTGPTIENVSFA